MTMLNTNYRNVLTSAGGTTFAYTFQIYANSDIRVVVADSDGSNPVTKLLDTDYTVTGAGSASGGNVVFTSAITASKKVILTLRPPLTQTLDLTVADALPAESLEAALDRLTSQVNSLQEKLNRCLMLPDSTPATATPVIPDYSITANQSKYLRLGTTGIEAADGTAGAATIPSTTKGDLVGHNGTAAVRVPVGADYQLLMAKASESPGLKWEDIHNVPGVTGIIGSVGVESNLIHNGQMLIWQRGTSFTTAVLGAGVADRWRMHTGGTTGNITVTQSTNVPTVTAPEILPRYSLRMAPSVADAVVDSSDIVSFRQRITGGTWRGYAGRDFVISFWCRSNVTGTYALALNNNAKDRGICTNFTVNAADTWQWQYILIPASPSAGTWVYEDTTSTSSPWNAYSMTLDFVLMAGTGLTSGTNNTWTTSAGTQVLRTSTANANIMSSTSNYFELYGVQADIGLAPVSQRCTSFEQEMEICRRFYRKSFAYGTKPAANIASSPVRFRSQVGASTATGFPMWMDHMFVCGGASGSVYNPLAANTQIRNVTRSQDFTASGITWISPYVVEIYGTSSAGTVAGDVIEAHFVLDMDFGST